MLNNVVVLAVLGVFVAVPGRITLDPVRLSDPKLLVLGIGTTLGIVAQALVLIPAVRRTGFHYRPLWGWDRRLTETGGLAVWVVAYVLIGQAGYIVTTRVAAGAAPGSVAIYSNAWLLLQVPYGVLGVSLLTALMPRMSRAAAEGRTADVVADLRLGTRLSAVVLLPVSALLTLFGTQLGVGLFSMGAGSAGEGSTRLGATLAASAFGLLPYAVMMLQTRVFYALTDSRTPTLLQLVIVGVKIPLLLAVPSCPAAAVGRARAGRGERRCRSWWVPSWARCCCTGASARWAPGAVLAVLVRMALASVFGAVLAFGTVLLVGPALPAVGPVGGSWIELMIAAVIGGPAVVVAMLVLRVPEVVALRRRVTGKVARPTERGDSGH